MDLKPRHLNHKYLKGHFEEILDKDSSFTSHRIRALTNEVSQDYQSLGFTAIVILSMLVIQSEIPGELNI